MSRTTFLLLGVLAFVPYNPAGYAYATVAFALLASGAGCRGRIDPQLSDDVARLLGLMAASWGFFTYHLVKYDPALVRRRMQAAESEPAQRSEIGDLRRNAVIPRKAADDSPEYRLVVLERSRPTESR